MTTSVAQVVGASARALRLAADVTLEEMARTAASYGLPWTSGRVGDFESGRVAPSLPTLIAATAALGDVIGRPVSLAELFAGEGRVQINDVLALDTSALRAAVTGEPVTAESHPTFGIGFTVASRAAETVLAKSQEHSQKHFKNFVDEYVLKATWPKRLSAVQPELRREVLRDFNESDARMCKNIGVSQELGAAAMAALWGRTFTAERNHRAGPGAKAQKRGQISRKLKAELQGVINDGRH